MKTKRCTNPSCRREFKLEATVCPHCGKEYPRVKNSLYAVILISCGPSKLDMIRVIRHYTSLGLKDSKDIVDHAPSLVGKGFQSSKAKELKADIRVVGGRALIVPGSHSMQGVFVLPKKVG